jgi:hypothetical protein
MAIGVYLFWVGVLPQVGFAIWEFGYLPCGLTHGAGLGGTPERSFTLSNSSGILCFGAQIPFPGCFRLR